MVILEDEHVIITIEGVRTAPVANLNKDYPTGEIKIRVRKKMDDENDYSYFEILKLDYGLLSNLFYTLWDKRERVSTYEMIMLDGDHSIISGYPNEDYCSITFSITDIVYPHWGAPIPDKYYLGNRINVDVKWDDMLKAAWELQLMEIDSMLHRFFYLLEDFDDNTYMTRLRKLYEQRKYTRYVLDHWKKKKFSEFKYLEPRKKAEDI